MNFLFIPVKPLFKTVSGNGIIDSNIIRAHIPDGHLYRAEHYNVYEQSNNDYIGLYMCTSPEPNAVFELINNNTYKKYEEFYNDLCIEMNHFLQATEKKVSIDIDIDDFNNLKNNGYSLCFAKKVGDEDYNVVWRAEKAFLQKDIFSWTPQYEIFATNMFQASVIVQAQTNLVTIGLGEQVTMSQNGVLSQATTGEYKNSITFINEYGSIHPGINQICSTTKGKTSTPIYVAKNSVVKGTILLKPVEKILVWFEQNIKTSTMFTESRSMSIELDLTNKSDISISYSQEDWKIV